MKNLVAVADDSDDLTKNYWSYFKRVRGFESVTLDTFCYQKLGFFPRILVGFYCNHSTNPKIKYEKISDLIDNDYTLYPQNRNV